MTEVKTIKCEIHCQNGESLHAAFPAVPGIWEREEIYVEVEEAVEDLYDTPGIPSNSSEPGENHGNVYAQ